MNSKQFHYKVHDHLSSKKSASKYVQAKQLILKEMTDADWNNLDVPE